MVRLVLFDFGETLVHDGAPFPCVPEALGAIRKFETSEGPPIRLGLVSDFSLPQPPVTEAKITALEAEFAGLLLAAGLADFFQPASERITLSARAGVFKPDRRIFELAMERSKAARRLEDCLFITENEAHFSACRGLGLSALRFGLGPRTEDSFAQWADGPLLIAARVAPESPRNRELAAGVWLSAHHGIVGFRAPGAGTTQSWRGPANRLVQLHNPSLGPIDGVFVELPTQVELAWLPDGRVRSVSASPPDSDALRDATNFAAGLVRQGRVSLSDEPSVGPTHEVVRDSLGRRRLTRRRFSSR